MLSGPGVALALSDVFEAMRIHFEGQASWADGYLLRCQASPEGVMDWRQSFILRI